MSKKSVIHFSILLLLITKIAIASAEPVCHKCEVIREANKHKVNKYEYYEDYLNANPDEAQAQIEQKSAAQKQQPNQVQLQPKK